MGAPVDLAECDIGEAEVDLASDDDGGTQGCSYDETSDGTAHLIGVYTLAATSLQVLNPYLTQADLDAALLNGAKTVTALGPGSGIDYAGGCPGTFHMITDRGPNGDRTAGDGKTFPLPGFTPTVATVHLDNQAIAIDHVLPIYNGDGAPVTGISNGSADDTPWLNDTATTPLPYDADGIDSEELRRLPSGDFAFCEEYSPSVGIIDGTTGKVKVRYTPVGVAPAAKYAVKPILPAILAKRRINKGLEGLALSPDGKTAWAVMQTPLGDDAASAYGNSLVNRVIRIEHFDDPAQAAVTGHFIVVHQTATSLPGGTKQKNVYFNAATFIAANKLLLLERVSNPTAGMPGRLKLMVADFSAATNFVGHPEFHGDTLEPEAIGPPPGYQTLQIVPATVTEVFDSTDVPAFLAPTDGSVVPDKLEGVAIINRTTVAIANDNDFGIVNSADRTRIWILRMKAPMF
jgi:hypothetical protein